LGYSFPVVPLSSGIQRQFGPHFELDAFGEYQVSHKAVLGNGHTVNLAVQPIVWLNHRVGLSGQFEYVRLTTSAYSKGTTFNQLSTYSYIPGVVFAGAPFGLPSRFYLYGYIPQGGIDPKTGIESNIESGVEFSWEAHLYDFGPFSLREAITPAVQHGYNQGNPQCDGTYGSPITCPRTSWTAFSVGITFRLVFPRDGVEWER
jgi:hypothetical protein